MEAEEEKLTITALGGGVCDENYHVGAKGEDEGDDNYNDSNKDDAVSWTSAPAETLGDAVFMVDITGVILARHRLSDHLEDVMIIKDRGDDNVADCLTGSRREGGTGADGVDDGAMEADGGCMTITDQPGGVDNGRPPSDVGDAPGTVYQYCRIGLTPRGVPLLPASVLWGILILVLVVVVIDLP